MGGWNLCCVNLFTIGIVSFSEFWARRFSRFPSFGLFVCAIFVDRICKAFFFRSMNVLVTGAAGYIGTNMALALRNQGFGVHGIDDFKDYYSKDIKRWNAKALSEVGVAVQQCDLCSGDLSESIKNVDGVVHFAGQPGISKTTPIEDYENNNVLATHRLIEACGNVRFFLNISSSSVYGLNATGAESSEVTPESTYGRTKLLAEQAVMAVQSSGHLSASSLRLFSVYGERERPEKLFPKLIRAIANDSSFTLFEGSLEHSRSFTYVGDVCQAILATLNQWEKAQGEIFNVGTDQSFTTAEAISAVEEVMGRKARVELIPARPGDQKATHANIDKIRSTLGWEPKASLKDGVSRMVDWYMRDVHDKIDWV